MEEFLLSGGGDISATGNKNANGLVLFTGGGALEATGTRSAHASEVLSGGGSQIADGFHGEYALLELSGGGFLEGAGGRLVTATFADSGGGDLSIIGAVGHETDLAIAGGGDLAAEAAKTHYSDLLISDGGDYAITAAKGVDDDLVVTTGGEMLFTGLRFVNGQWAITGGGTLYGPWPIVLNPAMQVRLNESNVSVRVNDAKVSVLDNQSRLAKVYIDVTAQVKNHGTMVGPQTWTGSGTDLNGWITVLGDALYAAPTQDPVTAADIETLDEGSYSILRANIHQRGVMAHNITYKPIADPTLLDSVHTVGFQFRVPYLPVQGGSPDNAQTVEGGFFVWDGANTRVDYGAAFQWMLSPYEPSAGTLNVWTGSSWQAIGFLTPDTDWHAVTMTFDRRNNRCHLAVDGVSLETALTSTLKPDSLGRWGTDLVARLQTEIVSLYPGLNTEAPSHRAEFRNWTWVRNAYTS